MSNVNLETEDVVVEELLEEEAAELTDIEEARMLIGPLKNSTDLEKILEMVLSDEFTSLRRILHDDDNDSPTYNHMTTLMRKAMMYMVGCGRHFSVRTNREEVKSFNPETCVITLNSIHTLRISDNLYFKYIIELTSDGEGIGEVFESEIEDRY